MTDRTISLLVTLEQEYRTDDAEFIINAIKMIKGVLGVDCIISGYEVQLYKQSTKRQLMHEMHKKISDFLEV